jgi:hypothetical protein
MLKRSLIVVAVALATLVLATAALAHPPDHPGPGEEGNSPGHSDEAAGQVIATESSGRDNPEGRTVAELNCRATWDLSALAGTTGSDNDHKQGDSVGPGVDTGVGNCDQWWTWSGNGSNGNHPVPAP